MLEKFWICHILAILSCQKCGCLNLLNLVCVYLRIRLTKRKSLYSCILSNWSLLTPPLLTLQCFADYSNLFWKSKCALKCFQSSVSNFWLVFSNFGWTNINRNPDFICGKNKCFKKYIVTAQPQPQPQPNSTSTRVGVDKVISWTTHPPTPHHT